MSEPTSAPVRPVSLLTTFFILALMAAFFFVVRHYYHVSPMPAFTDIPENLPKDLAWKANRDTRRQTLADLRKEQDEQQKTYGWVDKNAGVVRLPIERAMELTVQKYSAEQMLKPKEQPSQPNRGGKQ
jgi:hypothetical protein